MTVYDTAAQELLQGIPGLLEMSIKDGLKAIDAFALTWANPAPSFSPWFWFEIKKHNQAHPIQLS